MTIIQNTVTGSDSQKVMLPANGCRHHALAETIAAYDKTSIAHGAPALTHSKYFSQRDAAGGKLSAGTNCGSTWRR